MRISPAKDLDVMRLSSNWIGHQPSELSVGGSNPPRRVFPSRFSPKYNQKRISIRALQENKNLL